MNSTNLLTTSVFLASAPSPDSKTISEFSAGFLSAGDDYGLMAAELDSNTAIELAVRSATEENLLSDM